MDEDEDGFIKATDYSIGHSMIKGSYPIGVTAAVGSHSTWTFPANVSTSMDFDNDELFVRSDSPSG